MKYDEVFSYSYIPSCQQHLIIMRYSCCHCQRIDFVELFTSHRGHPGLNGPRKGINDPDEVSHAPLRGVLPGGVPRPLSSNHWDRLARVLSPIGDCGFVDVNFSSWPQFFCLGTAMLSGVTHPTSLNDRSWGHGSPFDQKLVSARKVNIHKATVTNRWQHSGQSIPVVAGQRSGDSTWQDPPQRGVAHFVRVIYAFSGSIQPWMATVACEEF